MDLAVRVHQTATTCIRHIGSSAGIAAVTLTAAAVLMRRAESTCTGRICGVSDAFTAATRPPATVVAARQISITARGRGIMTETDEEFGKGIRFCCEVSRTDSEHYELSFASKRGRPTICLVYRSGIDSCISTTVEHIVDMLERAVLVPIRIETPEHRINLGARDWWDSITTHATMIRMVAYGNKATDISCGFTMPTKFWEKMDNQTIVEIVCQSAVVAEQMAEQIRRNILC